MRAKTLVLPGNRIHSLVDMRRVLEISKKAFAAHARCKVQMPAKICIHLDPYNGDFRAMPAYVEGIEACGVKWVSVHPDNRKRGLPAVMALIILSDPATGFPLAVMDGTFITNLRTGAAGAIAASCLAKKGSSRIGFVGCGVQAGFQLFALSRVFKLKAISLYDADRAQAANFARRSKRLVRTVTVCKTVEECVSRQDIVITTTPSRKPIVRSSWISPGTHINAIGADAKGKEELDPAILKRARVVVDDLTQAMHSGEINVPVSKKVFKASDICATLGQVIIGKRRCRTSDSDITIFDSTGLAIQDIAVASYVYRKARSALSRRGRQGRGFREIDFS